MVLNFGRPGKTKKLLPMLNNPYELFSSRQEYTLLLVPCNPVQLVAYYLKGRDEHCQVNPERCDEKELAWYPVTTLETLNGTHLSSCPQFIYIKKFSNLIPIIYLLI